MKNQIIFASVKQLAGLSIKLKTVHSLSGHWVRVTYQNCMLLWTSLQPWSKRHHDQHQLSKSWCHGSCYALTVLLFDLDSRWYNTMYKHHLLLWKFKTVFERLDPRVGIWGKSKLGKVRTCSRYAVDRKHTAPSCKPQPTAVASTSITAETLPNGTSSLWRKTGLRCSGMSSSSQRASNSKGQYTQRHA